MHGFVAKVVAGPRINCHTTGVKDRFLVLMIIGCKGMTAIGAKLGLGLASVDMARGTSDATGVRLLAVASPVMTVLLSLAGAGGGLE